MTRARRSVLTSFLLTIVTTGSVAGCIYDDDPPTEQIPFRDDWRVEVDTEFPYIVDGEVNIGAIGIGGFRFNENFENRGDVIVKLDGERDRIKVEMRRFTWRMDKDQAAADFEGTELLAYAGKLEPPDDMPDENKCGRHKEDDPEASYPWMDGCGIRLYYRGQIQPSRLGADIRVTLPSNYRHSIYITTNDNNEEEEYLNRGDVCVENLNGNLDAELASGIAYVILDPETTPGPTCTEDEIADCEDWVEDGEPAPWGSDCLCKTFGSVKVEANGASNITIDAPEALWASLSLDNQGDNQTSDDHCNATIDWPGVVLEESDKAWKKNGAANHPSDAAPLGAGFSLRAVSKDCSTVLYTDSPGEYIERSDGEVQASEKRGALELCNDCLTGNTCEELLTGA